MGRHAAPGDDEPETAAPIGFTRVPDLAAGLADAQTAPTPDLQGTAVLPTPVRPTPRGRHAAADEDDSGETAPQAAVSPKRENASQADLRMLRSDPALRNRVIAAVIVPFVLYVVVLVAIGRLDAFAVWIWLPLVTAGVGGGVLLDRAHAHASR